jgi:hypothetical protein
VQLDAAKPAEADQAADVLAEGVKTVVEQAKENEGVKSVSSTRPSATPSASGTASARARRPR